MSARLTVHAEACACPSGHVHEFHTSVHVPSLRIYLACQELISTMSDQLMLLVRGDDMRVPTPKPSPIRHGLHDTEWG